MNVRVAWWANHGDEGFRGCGWLLNCRQYYRHCGEFDLLKQYDRLVQGVEIGVLIAETQAKVNEANEEHEKDKDRKGGPYLKRDRYGEYYPDYEGMRWARQHREKLERRLNLMHSGDWGPTHTIEIDGEGSEIKGTIEVFVS